MAAVIALKLDHVPMARPRSSSVKELLIMARLPGTSNAAPIPWSARSRNQATDTASEPARGGRRRENYHADNEYSAPAITVSQRTAHEEKRGEQERIRFNDPLHADDSGLQIFLERGQRDVHDGAVDEGEARTQNRRRENPLAG